MTPRLFATFAITATLLLAGCAETTTPPDDMPAGDYTILTRDVPATATAGTAFTFTMQVEGPEGTSDHVGAHYGANASAEPSTAVYDKACNHTEGTLPGEFTVSCTIAEPGTWHLRGHVRTGAGDDVRNFWGPDTTITVAEGATTPPPTRGTLRVGTDAAFPPFEDLTAEGEFVGFDMDLIREVGARAGYEVVIENIGWDPLIPALKNDQIDAAISAMSITPEREAEVDFSIPYYEANQSVTVRAEDAGKYASLEDMKGKGLKFGAQTGTVGADSVVSNFGEDNLTRYDTYPLALEALKRGDVDAVVMDLPAQNEAAENDDAIVVAFDFYVGDVYGIAVKKGNADLLAAINAALREIFSDGTYEELRTKWDV